MEGISKDLLKKHHCGQKNDVCVLSNSGFLGELQKGLSKEPQDESLQKDDNETIELHWEY